MACEMFGEKKNPSQGEKEKGKICTHTYVDGDILSTSSKSERPEDLKDCKC